ncbi:G2/mitotic-specific cyclin S13-7 [Punica granatum]|uniref:G2/mitotic-specific cyclin S13-7 n=1 Tax=Punica granatum TaxID=22663 RepID=A0A6P8DZI4_PUNGR|nr:G2/mitotic-specific cyclin S13-7 [Punica granatum]
MDVRADVIHQQPRGAEKAKNVLGEARNRRVLQDIGNLVTDRTAQVKPAAQIAHPVRRSFGAQLVAKAQAAATENKKPTALVIDSKLAAEPEPVPKQVARKPDPEDVILISSSESEKGSASTRRALRKGSSRKKALTSVLTARSKAACGLADKLNNLVIDIDEGDADNELAVVEYIEDLYKFYKETEDEGRVHDYMDLQPEVNAKMRMILLDWLVEVHRKFELMPETLYLTINIVDRYLSVKAVRKKELQLVGISAMLIASKYEEIWAPQVNDFVFISDNAYMSEQVLIMEKSILEKLEWYMTVPTPYVFLVRYIKASVPSDTEMENMVLFLAELGLMHYHTVIFYCPSMIAASAVYAARCTLNKSPLWTETLKHHTGYSADQLLDCAKLLVSFHTAAADSKLKAVYRKFSSVDHGTVSLLAPAKTLSVE